MIGSTASRFGLIADVHSNLQALETVMRHLDAEKVEEIWCLGDVVGYGGRVKLLEEVFSRTNSLEATPLYARLLLRPAGDKVAMYFHNNLSTPTRNKTLGILLERMRKV